VEDGHKPLFMSSQFPLAISLYSVTLSVSIIRCEEYYHLRSLADLSISQLFYLVTRGAFSNLSLHARNSLIHFLPLSAGDLLISLSACTLSKMCSISHSLVCLVLLQIIVMSMRIP